MTEQIIKTCDVCTMIVIFGAHSCVGVCLCQQLVNLAFHCVAIQVHLYFYVVGLENMNNLMHVFALSLLQHTVAYSCCLENKCF